jgi:hypothetical protein
MALAKNLSVLQIEGFTLKIEGKIIFRDIKFFSRKILQIKKPSQKLLSLLHLHLKSTKNKVLLNQV